MRPGRRRITVLLLGLLAGCAAPATPETPGRPSAPESAPLTFFLLVNQSGRGVRLEGRADGRVLFVEPLPAQPEAGGPRVRALPSPYPIRELKVPLPVAARTLEVADLESGVAARSDIAAAGAPNLGFRVVVDPVGIRISRDYYPIR